ncbi:probable bifunctional dTTP/UTP pyrophosphatase/methyltransferase protein isoform X2 [Lepus europaeus]|uniref:probable bifunctional dTTP/UTP pyrophosphatase/methyltransferase protein isoform X2 n=1 Tax=Lepus europaeus TaxID=9983 RepID=UPI002B495BDE|nr:probable bifunctional dTTP/UTP pyrophosphatase/methyltransferase protein isoform X2 [Lepus europaeus]
MVLCPVIGKLAHKRVVLASASPRRREILSNAGLRFEVVPSRFRENLSKSAFPAPHAYAVETARQKALEVAGRMHEKDQRAPDVVIGADTIVTLGGLILEKPVDKQDAYNMLSRLSGREHSVFTGVAIVRCSCKDGRLHTDVSEFHEETRVTFSELSEELLWEDKAGGYGIQALGGMLVERLHGDFLNVVGFPLNRFCKQLAELYPAPSPAPGQGPSPCSDALDSLSGLQRGGPEPPGGSEAGGSQGTGGTLPALPPQLLELMEGLKASKALVAACRLRVFDFLREAPQTAAQVAGKVAAPVPGTERLLDTCVGLGLLQKAERGYSNTELASAYLVSSGRLSIRDVVLREGDSAWNLCACAELADGVLLSREALPCFPDSPHGLARLTARRVATAFDLSRFSAACSLGGCTLALARELAREHPQLHVTEFDLLHAVGQAPCAQPPGQEDTQRMRCVTGGALQDPLPEASLYLLCTGLLGECADAQLDAVLAKVAAHCPPGGGLLLVETPARERPRSLAKYQHLLQRHGFGDVQVARAESGLAAVLSTRETRPGLQ